MEAIREATIQQAKQQTLSLKHIHNFNRGESNGAILKIMIHLSMELILEVWEEHSKVQAEIWQALLK